MLVFRMFPLFVGHRPESLVADQALSIFLLDSHEQVGRSAI